MKKFNLIIFIFGLIVSFGVNHALGIRVSEAYNQDETCMMVEIDVKPGRDPNKIRMSSFGLVSVAVLSQEGEDVQAFNAAEIDPNTVTFMGASPVSFGSFSVDANRDSLADKLLFFNAKDLALEEGEIEAILEGQLMTGECFMGMDDIVVLPRMGFAMPFTRPSFPEFQSRTR